MPRKRIPGTKPRTHVVHVESYNYIMDFFSRSPNNITGSDAIREVLYQFGMHCKRQMDAGRGGGASDLVDIKKIVLGIVAPKETAGD